LPAIRCRRALTAGSGRTSESGASAINYASKIGDAGVNFAPNLSQIGSRLTREQIIKSILEPSAEIAKGNESVNVETSDGELYTGLIDEETAANMDDQAALGLIFLPGFSTKESISSLSGRGVGMDVVQTKIQKLNGRIDIRSVVGEGTAITIHLPLTLAILPVLIIKVGEQPFAVPLSLVREIIQINPDEVQEVSGRPTMIIRDEVLPIRSLASMIARPMDRPPAFGVLMQSSLSAEGYEVCLVRVYEMRKTASPGIGVMTDCHTAIVPRCKELHDSWSGERARGRARPHRVRQAASRRSTAPPPPPAR
jgi:putative heme-binding domain-containing protein